MSKTLRTLALAASALALTGGPAVAEDHEMTRGEERLAKMLEGRVAGEAQSCLRTIRSANMQIIDGTAIVYKKGSTLWVNIPRNAEQLDDSDAVLTRQFDSRLCRTDIVTTFDRHAQFYTGNIFLGDFVPYRRSES